MLGYVIPDKGELKVREYEIYTGYYCGICKYIGRTYGQLPRMALSYDAAFLAILLASVDGEPDAPRQEHCAVHHIKYKTIIQNRAVEYAGDVMLILAWHKLQDDARDEGKVYAKATSALLKGQYRKLQEAYPELTRLVGEHLAELSALEEEQCPSIDRVAESFSHIMAVIFREGSRLLYGEGDFPENLHETFAKVGYHMGKWIYLIDAVDDIEENLQSGAYNPLFPLFGFDGDTETAASFRERINGTLQFNLYHYLAVISESLKDLDIRKNSGIIENVVYFGLNRKTEEILKGIRPPKRTFLGIPKTNDQLQE